MLWLLGSSLKAAWQPTHLPRPYPIHCRSWLASEDGLKVDQSLTAVFDPL
jgi:hypothetical protein